jgi:K+/H+ antiporter YhaU regulatory subunit KhtT
VDVNEVLLPGIGLRYEFTSAEGRRIGIVARREGSQPREHCGIRAGESRSALFQVRPAHPRIARSAIEA